jgi:hypothetical protein
VFSCGKSLFALQSVRVRHFREDFQAGHAVEHIVHGKVRGMIVKGMGKCVFRTIPLTYIPLTFLPAFPSSIPLWLRLAALCLLRLLAANPFLIPDSVAAGRAVPLVPFCGNPQSAIRNPQSLKPLSFPTLQVIYLHLL